jgi:7-keto-8-aminopelargonate synthetase-like enzyme
MAKTKHNNILDTVEDIFSNAQKRGVMQLNTVGEQHSGRMLNLNGRDVLHFGTCGYLGLESDIRLKNAIIEATFKHGVQFPVSRAYVTSSLNNELEDYLEQMYGHPAIVSTTTSLGHIGVIPNIVRDEDAVILDHQVHASIQNAVNLTRVRGVTVEMIRHNNMEMLEKMIIKLRDTHAKIWYMIDGVFSMYGDYPPLKQLVELMNKHEQLHLYADDAHGMSWAGKNGCGYVLSEIDLHEKMVLASTLGKAFGCGGGIFVFPKREMWKKIRQFGGAMGFSHPIAPPMIGAAIASAKIHLSDEIYSMQNDLQQKIGLCNTLLSSSGLPMITNNNSPIFFVGTGLPSVGYNIVDRLLKEGFYVNLAVFPAVPVKNTGIRFSISRNLTHADIIDFVEALKYHYPKALEEESYSLPEVRKAFKLPVVEDEVFIDRNDTTPNEMLKNKEILNEATDSSQSEIRNLKMYCCSSIQDVNKEEWDRLLGSHGSFDWEGMNFLEKTFGFNPSNKPEDNWDFFYCIIKDHTNKPVLATFFTSAMWKEDMLAPYAVSKQIEDIRKNDPYYLTSKALTLGCFFTEGLHLYLDKGNSLWQDAFNLLLNKMTEEHERLNTSVIILRDFDEYDPDFKDYMINNGFVKIDMPETCVVDNLTWADQEEFINNLSYKSRKHFRKDILKFEEYYEVEVKSQPSKEEIDYFYRLHLNVRDNNYDINVFEYPRKTFEVMAEHPNWEFIVLRIKPAFDKRAENLPVAVMFAYKNPAGVYCPMIIGMDYVFLEEFNVYRQCLYQTIKRAKDLKCNKVNFGLSATFEKKKLGATVISKVAYVQVKDNFNMELMSLMEARY